MFSLCIPTMDRYDRFLSKNLPRYLEDELVSEVVVSDENGSDVAKIRRDLSGHPGFGKLRLFQNGSVLGPFSNKLRACRLARCRWIALIDSDNFAGPDYFETARRYIGENVLPKETVLAPSFASPHFDFGELSNTILSRERLRWAYETRPDSFQCFFNTGNYVINRYLIDSIDVSREVVERSPYDVIHFNVLLYEQFPVQIHVVDGLKYDHLIHPGSTSLRTARHYGELFARLRRRTLRLFGRR